MYCGHWVLCGGTEVGRISPTWGHCLFTVMFTSFKAHRQSLQNLMPECGGGGGGLALLSVQSMPEA